MWGSTKSACNQTFDTVAIPLIYHTYWSIYTVKFSFSLKILTLRICGLGEVLTWFYPYIIQRYIIIVKLSIHYFVAHIGQKWVENQGNRGETTIWARVCQGRFNFDGIIDGNVKECEAQGKQWSISCALVPHFKDNALNIWGPHCMKHWQRCR